jgi:hypothetical protein
MTINDDRNNRPKAKTDVRYWEERVSFQTPTSRTYSVQIQHAKRREIINLRTANKADAANLARKFYLGLLASGWEETRCEIFGMNSARHASATRRR